MKTLIALALAAVVSIPSFAQTFSLNGEIKTGIIWEKIDDWREDDSPPALVFLGSKDDAGDFGNRFRLDMGFTNAAGNMGLKARVNWEVFNNAPINGPSWDYGFAWGSFFNDQFTLSLGKLGASPWGTGQASPVLSGGPEMWRELEVVYDIGQILSNGGIRFEYKPAFVPGELNVGFVLNWINSNANTSIDRDPTLKDVLQETVVGASYKNDWFMFRFAYRFDSEMDYDPVSGGQLTPYREGGSLVYRFEEYALQRWAPGLSLWALGEFDGIGSAMPHLNFSTRNWFFVQYAPPSFTAQVRFGLEAERTRQIVLVRPSFFYNLFGGLVAPGFIFGYANDFGDGKMVCGSSFSYYEVEPKVQVNLAPGAYVAFSYYWRWENRFAPPNPEQQTQWINLRAGITF